MTEVRDHTSSFLSNIERIPLSQIALLTLGVEVVIRCFATLRPRQDMVHVKFDTGGEQRAAAQDESIAI